MTRVDVMAGDTPVEWSRLVLRGPDAVSFLDGQWTQTTPEKSGDSAKGAVLQPDGVVVCAVNALRTGLHDVALDVPRDSAELLETRLRRFRLRVRVDFEWDLNPVGEFTTVAEQVDLGAPGPREFAVGYVAQSFGERFVAERISFTKGCFTGQELVGRLDARGGSAPYRLARVEAAALEDVEQWQSSWESEAQRRGALTTVMTHEGGVRALALVHRTTNLQGEGWTGEWL